MALNKLDANVEVVQTLGTYPNQENGLSAEELKEKFDEGSKILKEYLNEQVVPAVNDNADSIEKNKQDIAENKKALEDSESRLKAVEDGAVATDATLKISGKPADAAAVGKELENMVARFKIEDDHLALNNTGDPAEAYEEIRSAYLANKTVLLYEDVSNQRNIYLCVGYDVNKETDFSRLYFARFEGSTLESIELQASGYLTKKTFNLSENSDVYAAEFNFYLNTLSNGSFSEMLDAFLADKVVTLSYTNPAGNEFCFYCTHYDIGYESEEHFEFVGNEFGEYTTICVYPDGRITKSKVAIGGSVGDAVLYTEQDLPKEQQEQARENIGLENSPIYTAVNKFFVGEDVFTADKVRTAANWTTNGNSFTHASGSADPLHIALGDLAVAGEEWLITFDCPSINDDLLYLSFGSEAQTQVYNGTISFAVALRVKENGDDLLLTPVSRFSGTITNFQIRKISVYGTELYEFTTDSITNMDRQIAKTGFWNVILGTEHTMTKALNSSRTIAIGHNVLHNLISGNRNLGIGTFVMQQMNNGEDNLGFGADTMGYLDEAMRCTAVGVKSLTGYTARVVDCATLGWAAGLSGNQLTAVGSQAGVLNKGDDNTFIGCRAGAAVVNGSKLIVIGSYTEGQPNGTFIVCIGRGANYANGSTNVVVIGKQAVATKSNQVVIGNSAIEEVILGGKKLIFNADGTVSWEAI